MQFKSSILVLPGLGNSGKGHWQTIWQNRYGFERVEQTDWETPVCDDWVAAIDAAVVKNGVGSVILVAHSLANTTVAAWAKKYNRRIKGALLVGPSDTEADTYPAGTIGFAPMALNRLPFPTIAVASDNDFYVTSGRAAYFASCWGSKLVTIGNAGHINVASGHGEWEEGLRFLQELDEAG